MKKGFFVAVLVLFLGMGSVHAQTFFTMEKTAFYNELSAYLNSATSKKDRDEAAVVMQNFGVVW